MNPKSCMVRALLKVRRRTPVSLSTRRKWDPGVNSFRHNQPALQGSTDREKKDVFPQDASKRHRQGRSVRDAGRGRALFASIGKLSGLIRMWIFTEGSSHTRLADQFADP